MSVSKGQIVVVLGMHRSGTSVTTNLLNAFGIPLSDDLMEPTADNAKGYFESKEIAKIHDDILAVFGMKWSTSNVVTQLPQNWIHAPAVQPLKAHLRAIVQAEVERHNGLWGFKDPRTARLLPLWNEIFQELALEPRFVLVTRHPSDVAKSLFSREQIAPMHAELLWLDHNADALVNTKGRLNAIVDYQAWMDAPVEQAAYMIERMGIPFAGTRDDVAKIVADVVASDLRHHASAQSAFMLPFTAPFYDALRRRDVNTAVSLAEVLNIARGFTNVVLANATQELHGQIAELRGIAEYRGGVVAALQAELAAARRDAAHPLPERRES